MKGLSEKLCTIKASRDINQTKVCLETSSKNTNIPNPQSRDSNTKSSLELTNTSIMNRSMGQKNEYYLINNKIRVIISPEKTENNVILANFDQAKNNMQQYNVFLEQVADIA